MMRDRIILTVIVLTVLFALLWAAQTELHDTTVEHWQDDLRSSYTQGG